MRIFDGIVAVHLLTEAVWLSAVKNSVSDADDPYVMLLALKGVALGSPGIAVAEDVFSYTVGKTNVAAVEDDCHVRRDKYSLFYCPERLTRAWVKSRNDDLADPIGACAVDGGLYRARVGLAEKAWLICAVFFHVVYLECYIMILF